MEKKEFSRENTLALKGIAIIMMMFHHCFRVKSLFKGYKVSFFPLNQEFVIQMSLTFKICVSFFVFITGYGLFLSLKKLNEKNNWTKKEICQWTVDRLIKLLSGFWIITIFSYIFCQIMDGRTGQIFFKNGILYGITDMLLNFLGLSNLFKTNTFNSAWWYMTIAVLFVIAIPVLVKLFNKYGYFTVIAAVIAIPRLLGWKYVNSSFISFLFPLCLGCLFAEKNLMVRIANFKIGKNKYMSKCLKFIIETVLLIVLYLLYSKLNADMFWEIRYGLIPVCLMIYLYEFYIDLPVVKQVLKFLGKHSMNIFLIHEFIRTYYFTNWLYSFKNFTKIAIVLLLSSLAISICIEFVKKIIRFPKIVDLMQSKVDKLIKE